MHLRSRDLHPHAQPGRFYDGGTLDERPDATAPARIVLERMPLRETDGEGAEVFVMLRRIGYRDEEFGDLLVPADPGAFRTDLTSVPTLFTWLVPKTGHHLPPVLLHDALVVDTGPAPYLGERMDRVGADRVFRRAMRDTHVGTVRRWLVWSAVTLATIWVGSSGWSRGQHLRHLGTMLGTLLLIAVIGAVATLDLFDLVAWLPWMGERPWWLELLGGLSAAVVVPLLLGLAWGRFAAAGMITGVALGVLLHVTAALAVLTVIYQVVERVARRQPVATIALGGAVLLACVVLTSLLIGTAPDA